MKLKAFFIIFFMLMLLCACSNGENQENNIINWIKKDLNENINLNGLVYFGYLDEEIVLYQSSVNKDIYLYIFRDGEMYHSQSIKLSELNNQELVWNYSELSDQNINLLFGGVSKGKIPVITVNEEYFEGHIISFDEIFIYIDIYEKPLDLPINVKIKNKESIN